MDNPLVSILIPTYNRAGFIGETLDSVIFQTYQNWECIIVDDGSTDYTMELMEYYCNKFDKIKFYSRPLSLNKGASVCRNFALKKSSGVLIQFLDSDDLLVSNKIEEQLKLYNSEKEVLITCKWGGFEDNSNLIKLFKYKYHSYKNFKKGINLLHTFGKYNEYFPIHVYLTPRYLIDKSGIWNEGLSNNDDAEFFSRVILNATKIIFAPNTGVYYRYTNNSNLGLLNSEEKLISALQSWKLIDSHIKKRYPNIKIKYVRKAKFDLYNLVLKTYPHLLVKEWKFFEDRYKYKSIFNKYRLIPNFISRLKRLMRRIN